jgi:hypothetical protein
MVDDIAIVKSLHTEQINHEPAITYMQTGSMLGGRPCIGSWLAYGLGNMTDDLPTFVVMNGFAATRGRQFKRCRRGCGAPDSCPRDIRACRSERAQSPYCSSTILREYRRLSAGGCSMH